MCRITEIKHKGPCLHVKPKFSSVLVSSTLYCVDTGGYLVKYNPFIRNVNTVTKTKDRIMISNTKIMAILHRSRNESIILIPQRGKRVLEYSIPFRRLNSLVMNLLRRWVALL